MVALAVSLLGGRAGRDTSPAAASEAVMAEAVAAAEAAQAQQQQCVRATNLAHAQAERATRWLLFVWARGSNEYLGLIGATTSLREGPAGTWALVESCEPGEPGGPDPTGAAWPTVGYDLASTRAPLDENDITSENIETLGRAWQLADIRGVTGTPIVSDGTLYVGDWANQVRALDAATGAQVWARDVGRQVPGAVAVDDDRVYAGTWDARLVALDRQTGTQAWEVEADSHELAVVYGSPVAVDDLVIVPVASDEWWDGEGFTFRGSVAAFDAATGEERWRYWTSCGPENAGQDNCPADGPDEGPGVGVWAYPVVDTERGLVYFGTGNHYERPTTDRSDALVAVDLATGEEEWVHQFTPDDWWNLPGEGNPNVEVGPDADVMVASLFQVGDADAVGVGDKAGNYSALDRETGEVLWSEKLTDGSIQGGVMASAAVVDGGRVGRSEDVIYLTANRGGTVADLIALDAADGSVLDRVDVGGGVVSPVTWANGFVYLTDNTGRVAAHDTADGLRRVWSWRTDAPAAGGIAVVDGMVYAGWGWALNGNSPNGGLIAFELDGEPQGGEPPPPPDGEALYAQNCAACHGADGSGGAGPSLRGIGQAHSIEEITDVVANGRGSMPAWRDQMTAEEIAAVVAYVASLPGDHEHDHDDEHGDHDHETTTTTAPDGTTTTTGPDGTTTTTHGDHEH